MGVRRATLKLQLSAQEVRDAVSLSDNAVTHEAFNLGRDGDGLVLNDRTTPAVDDCDFSEHTLTSGSATIDLMALDAESRKIVGIVAKAPAANGALITLAKGASNGHTGLGSSFSLKMSPGDHAAKCSPDSGIRVFGDNKNLTLTGTGSADSLQVGFLFGQQLTVHDTFTGDNDTDLEAHAPDIDQVGGGWNFAGDCAFEIQGNRAVATADQSGGLLPAVAWIDFGQKNFELRAIITRTATNFLAGVVFDYVDANNWKAYALQGSGGGCSTNYYTCVDGVLTPIGGASGTDNQPSVGESSQLLVRVHGDLLLTVDTESLDTDSRVPAFGEGNWILGSALTSTKVGIFDHLDESSGVGTAITEFLCRPVAAREVAWRERHEQSQGDVTINAGSGAVTLTLNVVRLGPLSGTVTVNYATSNVTATAGVDYTATSGTLTFAAGETAKTIAVPIASYPVGDGITFAVTLSNPVNAVIANTAGVLVNIINPE